MLNTHRISFRIISFILSLALIISSFSSVGSANVTGAYKRTSASVIYPDAPKYLAAEKAKDIHILKDVSNDTNKEGDIYETPLEIYNYIRTHISSDLGIKCRRSSEEVMNSGRATASENAALLVKMLRDKGYEAKYVYGQAILKADKASWMTGATSIEKAAEIYKENGIKYIKLTSGGSTVGLIVDHIWVRAYLPMSDYRGAKNNSGEYAWVDLDTYVKEHNLSSVEPLKVLPFSLQYETRGLNGSGEPKVLDELPEEVKVKDTEPPKEDDNDDISENTNGLTVLFTSPESEDALTAPTDIVGTASSDTGKIEYTLGYRPEGKGDFIEFAKGDKNVNSSTLGKFDPTLLANGRYQIRLTAKDDKGNTKKLTRVVNVEGALKVGNYHIGFTDITANLAGTTVNVNRIYDSSVKESGDFGYGWSMTMQGLNIYENASLADGYKMVQSGSGFSTRYQMTETKNHDFTVTYGDGTSDRFELVFFPAMGVLRPIQEIEQLGYKCVTNQKVRLEILTDTSGTVSGGSILFYENGVYDTINYRLTTENGEKLYINKNKGVYKIEDASGDIITVDDDGYHAANGKSIEFKRDKENRVTEATDPLGNTTTYKYNNAGDLISVTDSADRTVTYTYDKYHNLVSITDPMGIAVSRNEYDDEGRLIATIDADGNRMEFDHDVDGRQEVVKDRRGNSTAYTYDERGNVIQTKDALGNIAKNTYDANNNCIETTDANGHTTKYAYDANGNVTKVTAADGTVVESTYSEENYVTGIKMLDKTVMAMTYANNGALTSVSDANGNKTEYEYSADGKLTGMTDAIGVYQKMTYDPEGNVVSTTNGAGESAYYTYNDQNRCSSVTIKRNEDGKEISFTSRYTYDDADNITQSVDNAGNVTTYEYDANGNQIASVDSKNRRISYEYDHQANLVKTIYPDGTSESFEYDANGNNISATDRSGLKVTMEYDKLDRMISKTYADGNKESYAYDAVGNVIEQVGVTGAKTTYVYDECNRNTSIKDPLGYTTKFTYDAQSKLTSRMDAKNNKTTYVYDDNGNIIKTTYPDGGVVSAQYDARNRVISQTDQRGYTTKYEYDGADKLTKVTDHLKNSYVYTYDANGNLVKVTDPLNHSTQYTYDAVGHVQSVKNAAGKAAEYDYDSTGKLVYEKDFAGHETKYSYDDMDRVVSKKTADNDISYTYTEDGLLSSVKDKNGTVGYKYDKFNRLTSYTDAKNITVSYEYDQYGNIASIDNGFKKTNYEYDKLNRLTRVIDHNGNATVYEYDVLGNRSAVRYPNGNVMSYTYDACQRLKTEIIKDSSGKQIFKCNYNLGRCGERLNVYDEELSAETDAEGKQQVIKTSITYSYDSLLRLTREDISRGTSRLTISYSYDKVSNRVSKEVAIRGDISDLADVDLEEIDVRAGKTTFTYNELNQLVSEKFGDEVTTYTYDDNGNLVKEQGEKTKDYTYDSENHLMSATVQQGNSVTVEEYTYDYAGNRTSKAVNEVDVTGYINDIYGDLTYVLGETDKDGKLKKSYTRGQELISAETVAQNASVSDVHYFLYDGHGSTRVLTDKDGNVTDRYSYDGYGILLEKEGDTENDFLYTGEQYNYTTELYYLRARYMDPSTGTFISMDSYAGSLSDPITLHKYLYANANPVMNTDPSGNFSLCECIVSVGQRISMINQKIHQIKTLQNIMNYANAACTVYDTLTTMKEVWAGQKSMLDVAVVMLRGIAIGYLINLACASKLGVVLKPMLGAWGVKGNVDELSEAIKKKDPVEIIVRTVQLVCAIFGMTSQCFTGDTLVSTENGLVPIENIREGDLVWTENIDTGEQELKPVTRVFVNKTDRILHLTILSDGRYETIDTTEGHPFYVEGKGWVQTKYLETGDVLRKEDKGYAIVVSSWLEETEEPVYIFNLNVQDNHTYYVSTGFILVHNSGNECAKKTERKKGSYRDLKKEGVSDKHHIIQDAAVKDIDGYSYYDAPAAQLDGPASSIGTDHYNATQAQKIGGDGTYGGERNVAYRALRAAGFSVEEAKEFVRYADEYFMGKLGLSLDSPTRMPSNRKTN